MTDKNDNDITDESGVDRSDLFCCLDCGSSNVVYNNRGMTFNGDGDCCGEDKSWDCLDCNESHMRPPYKQNSENTRKEP
jgi:hypothetical protein